MKLLQLAETDGRRLARKEVTPIDGVFGIRMLRIYDSHNQKNAIDFIFRIHTIWTDKGPRVLVAGSIGIWGTGGVCHDYVKPSPSLNGEVDRPHLNNELWFYQLLAQTDDVDLRNKLAGEGIPTSCTVRTRVSKDSLSMEPQERSRLRRDCHLSSGRSIVARPSR